MNAYAPNNASSGGGGYASLSSSLLARKGEALPAVDAVAHEGVDIEMRPMKPANSPGAPKNIDEDAIRTFYAHNGGARPQAAARNPNVRLVHASSSARPNAARPAAEAPDAWTLPGGRSGPRARPAYSAGAQAAPATGILARKAIVSLRMQARDLVRLRLASRDLEMSCQAIILDALECYLDANDVPSASDNDAIRREVERLMAKAKSKRSA
jgi:hypothetical protein